MSKAVSNLINFSFENKEIRTVLQNNEPWFCAKDIIDAMGYGDTGVSERIRHIPEEWKGIISTTTLGGVQDLWFLSEQGVNFFAIRSNKPKALPFQKWLAADVIPSIRKTGNYLHPAVAEILAKHGLQSVFNSTSPEDLEAAILRYKTTLIVDNALNATQKIEETQKQLQAQDQAIRESLSPDELKLLTAKEKLLKAMNMSSFESIHLHCHTYKGTHVSTKAINRKDFNRMEALYEIYLFQKEYKSIPERIHFSGFFALVIDAIQEKIIPAENNKMVQIG